MCPQSRNLKNMCMHCNCMTASLTILQYCGFVSWINHLPFGLVETKGTTPKYPEVRTSPSMMSSKMLFLQSSPSQLRHVALPSSAEVKINVLVLCSHDHTTFPIIPHTASHITPSPYLLCYQCWCLIWADWSLGVFYPAPPSYYDCRNPSHWQKEMRVNNLISSFKAVLVMLLKTKINTCRGWQTSPSFCLAASKFSCLLLALIASIPSVMMFLPWTNISSSKWKLAFRA